MLERHDRIGAETSSRNSRGDPRRPLLSAGQPAREAVRCRQGAALSLLRRERRRARPLRQAARGDGGGRDRQARGDRRHRAKKRRRRPAPAVGRGGARPGAGGALRRRLPVALDRHRRQPRPDARARGAPDGARRRRRAQHGGHRSRGSGGRDRRLPDRDRERRRDQHAHRQEPRARRGLRRDRARPHAQLSAGYRVPETYPREAITSRFRAARPSSISSIPCRRAPGSASTSRSTPAAAPSSAPTSNGRTPSATPSTIRDGARRARFAREIRRYWPGLPEGALQPDFVGVRPKIYREGEPVADFAIHGPAEHGLPRLVALYGIESPGLTSSLAIGEHVAALLA